MSIGVGIDLHFTDTGDGLRKEMAKYAGLRAPLDAGLLPDDLHGEALLQDHSMDAGMAPVDGTVVVAGEMHRCVVSDRGNEKE